MVPASKCCCEGKEGCIAVSQYRSIAVSQYRGIAVRGLRAWTSAEDAICFALEGMGVGSAMGFVIMGSTAWTRSSVPGTDSRAHAAPRHWPT